MPEPGGGPVGPVGPLNPQYLADQLTLFQPGVQILPTLYYLHPQIFSPSGITEYYCKSLPSMAIRVVEFSNGGYKIRKIFAEESTYSKEIIEFWELG